ncbi:hypothetical protein LTR53_018453 [Teratosphaeriaceae sp. CCFEE 6253]|nr:hypothetical protein LTR53_018453 [Teratosphaeriaceae sp. CCFEE 6253]
MATAINILGVLFLSHSVYSAYEHSLLPPSPLQSTPSALLPPSLDPKVTLPLDITLETLLSVFLLCAGVVLSSADLKPIQWRVWAGQMEKRKEAREIREVGVVGGNPYEGLEERGGFWDVRAAGRGKGALMGAGEAKAKANTKS